ncbi:MAG: hypothetical protein RRY29_08075 [Desulfovibrionaceae bacterium]
MAVFFQKIGKLWREFRKRRQHASEISPRVIGQLARELADLAEIVERGPDVSGKEAQYLHSLKEEMTSLVDMAQRPEFCHLSADRRLALHHSLHRSHEKLLASVQSATSSTERIQ